MPSTSFSAIKERYKQIIKEVEQKTLRGEKVIMGRILQERGFAPTMVKYPNKITKSKTWRELVEQRLKDDKLLTKLNEGLESTKIVASPTEPDREVPDMPTRHRYLETALKLKGHLSDTGTVVAVQVNLDPKRQNNLKSVFVDGE